jgi:autoinducer 2-degrading protein
VWVEFQIHPGKMDQFMQLMLANARASQAEPGCSRFDLLAPETGGDSIALYEVYASKAAFKEHLAAH